MEDFLFRYNTELPKEAEIPFNQWLINESKTQGRDVWMDMYDYDLKGFFLSGEWQNKDSRGHGTDKFKKPNHPTFSNESVYHGVDGFEGGVWGDGTYTPSKTNLKFLKKEQLNYRQYSIFCLLTLKILEKENE